MDDIEKCSGFAKALQLVTLFLERRGCSLVGVQRDCLYHRNYVATDGVNSCLVSVYNSGALVIGGEGGGRLRNLLESFRTIVGGKAKGA